MSAVMEESEDDNDLVMELMIPVCALVAKLVRKNFAVDRYNINVYNLETRAHHSPMV